MSAWRGGRGGGLLACYSHGPIFAPRRAAIAPPSSPSRGILQPGDYVRHPQQPDWGVGQVQSMIGMRITVNFEHRGKVLIDGGRIELEKIDPRQL